MWLWWVRACFGFLSSTNAETPIARALMRAITETSDALRRVTEGRPVGAGR